MILCVYSAKFGRLRRVVTNPDVLTQQAWEAIGPGIGPGEEASYVPFKAGGYSPADLQAIVTQQTGLDPEALGDCFATVLNGVVVAYGTHDQACGDFPSDPGSTMFQVRGVAVGWTCDGKFFAPVFTAEELANMQLKGAAVPAPVPVPVAVNLGA